MPKSLTTARRTLSQEKLSGAFAGAWASALAASGLEVVDVASHLADIMSPKDEEEVKNVKKAAYLASQTMATFAVQQIEGEATRILGQGHVQRTWWGHPRAQVCICLI